MRVIPLGIAMGVVVVAMNFVTSVCVITSYSIHYTKLYEKALIMKP